MSEYEYPLQFQLEFGGLDTRVINSILRKREHGIRPFPRGRFREIAHTEAAGQKAVEEGAARLLARCRAYLNAGAIALGGFYGQIELFEAFEYGSLRYGRWGAEPVRPIPERDQRFGEYLTTRDVDLLYVLRYPVWLVYVAYADQAIRDDVLTRYQLHTERWPEQPGADGVLRRICQIVWRRLRKDPTFLRVRRQLAMVNFNQLNSEITELTIRSRPDARAGTLVASHYELVLRYRKLYRRMGRENPRLLPLLTAWLREREAANDARITPETDDALPLMRADLLQSGLTPRAWRYLVHHGVKSLVWRRRDPVCWSTVCEVLRSLQAARWPALPPRGFLGLLSDVAGRPREYEGGYSPGWFWNWACDAAHGCEGDTAGYEQLRAQVTHWAYWVHQYRPSPDANQQRARLRWLDAWAKRVERATKLDATPRWATWLNFKKWARWLPLQPVALQSSRDLIQEAWALHNCADRYEDDCRDGNYLLISLRGKCDGRHVALLGLRADMDDGTWQHDQLAGPCNQPAPDAVARVAHEIEAIVSAESAYMAAKQELQRVHAMVHADCMARARAATPTARAIPQRENRT